MGQASYHQSSHRGIDERFACRAEPLVILALPLRGHGRARDLLPDPQSLGHLLAALWGGQPMASRSEVLGNGTIGSEETLGVPR
jgi:hypothetical protein